MVSGKTGIQPRFGPSSRILELAQHKVPKTIWVTTPCTLTWGNQDSMWPLSFSALGAVPTDRIQYLSRHKRVFSACDDHLRPPHTSECEYSCPIWHISPQGRLAETPPRLLQLASPKRNHPSFTPAREKVETYISYAAKTARTTPRLDMLSLPKMKQNQMFMERGRPEDPIWLVSKAAKKATASPRLTELSAAKQLSKDYIPLRDPVWPRSTI
ncbi:testicular haploid expressed gene protein-like isoform X4 [Hypomesus transpacificus]|uniref:testicular haploid expressed gene protein-like isoform X4 n=1 Tax=Hypomesus transpacificus TaxID=137520 RepID=UPI001F0808FE|nr:testicular haploid expressed gene protein-like isoform X4 [Hypomesus transpacificus]